MKKSPLLLIKASSIPPGAHWITVRPNGTGKGQPVLIQPQEDGSAKVIGGAGGSLNHLKLRGVKSKAEYREEAKARQADKKAKRKAQVEADKAAGTHEAKQQARQALKEQKKAAERKVIEAVASKAGWDKAALEFPEEDYAHLSEKALAKVKDRHHRQLLARAKDAINSSRDRLVNEKALQAAAGIGEVPLTSDDPEALTVADLDPVKATGRGLGFNADYKGRAERAGLDEQALAAETQAFQQAKLGNMTDAQKKAAFARGESQALLKQELEGIKTPAAPTADASLLSAQDALELVKEGKRLANIEKAARQAAGEIDNSPTEPKAFVLETGDADLDAEARAAIENDLRTTQTVAFLSEVSKIAGGRPEETLGGHIGVGAYNSINSLALAVGGEALVDRSVVDVLGIGAAAQVLARRLNSDLSASELAHVADGMQDWHVNHYMQTTTDALAKARDLQEAAAAIDVSPEAKTGADLAAAQELNARRRAAVGDAQRILGQAMGEMEANAALVMALKQKPEDDLEVSLGRVAPDSAIKQVRALGLLPGDYHLEHVAGDTFLRLNASGLDRLAKPVSREDVQQVRRNLDIIEGRHDEEGWLPLGVANRPDLAMDVKPGSAPRLAQPFEAGADLEASLRDYIGGRAADGDPPADILADIQSAEFFQKVGAERTQEYAAALDAVAPLKDADGKQQRAEALADTFNGYADAFAAQQGGAISPLNRQKVEIDQHSVDALHRALSATPEGAAAYKPIGELEPSDQRALREFFHREIAKESPEAAQLRADLEAHDKAEPEKSTTDMFGDEVDNPEHKDWRAHRENLVEKINSGSLTWSRYVGIMGGNARAYEAVQDGIRSHLARDFVEAHNKLKPGSPIKLGRTVIRNNLRHLDAVDPAAREARQAADKALVDRLRNRVGGKYASGSVADKIGAAKEQEAAFSQAQMGFFSAEPEPDAGGGEPKALGADERHTLGHAAERQLAAAMEHVGANFKPGQPTKLWNVSMSGKYINQQRAVKMIAANKRVGLAFGAGSGKTNIMLGAFAHLHGEGKAKRALMLVPSIVQGQFAGEATRLLEPGKFKWHIEPGASRESRLAAYKDPDTHFAVMTHQSFRDDMIHLGAKHAGIDEAAMSEQLGAMSDAERKAWAKGVMDKEGMHFDASFVDEAHETLNRAGKENSALANVVDGVSANTPYYAYASGDPVKNDASEIHSMLQKLDPERYADRDAFMRRYGADTLASRQALKQEMARYVFPATIGSGVQADRQVAKVQLTDAQHQAIEQINGHLEAARKAHKAGKVDVEAARGLSPGSFEGAPESDHEAIAANIQKSLGVIKSSAINRVINAHEDNAKVKDAVAKVNARKGKQGVIFARNRASVEAYRKALEAEGHRVLTITGSDGGKEKDAKRRLFNPEAGESQADVMIMSDAGAVGMNLQSAHYLIQHDVPDTAKTHSQRNARIDRLGQKNAIELIDMVADHPEEQRARDRLSKKYDLKNMMADPLDGLDDTGVAGAIKARRNAQQATLDL